MDLTNSGNLTTSSNGAIIAIANGGNGGHGGDSDINNAGEGGTGGMGGTVTARSSTGAIITTGPNSVGILVLSTGGRGGNGGDSGVSGEGGTGGFGGAGGTATVNNSSGITTSGNGSAGIVARSVGGRGGDGGEGGDIIGPGGGGGATGNGGNVFVTNSGVILTNNDNSFGIFAQSTGGSAGAAGSGTIFGIVSFAGDTQSGGAGGNVTVDTTGGSITTHGKGSAAIMAQSVGGGGGAGGTGASLVGFGGAGGAGGAGQTVNVTNRAALVTTDHGSGGIVAQSVGGGGGSAGAAAGLVAIGGGGGAGGAGGAVDVKNFNSIDVSGNGADADFGNYGIFAQSLGGSGGSASGSGGLVAIGGTAGGGGNASTVSVTNDSSIISHCTDCRDAGAIYAQSIGGGGGRGGNSGGLFAIGGSGGSGGTAGAVTVTNGGTLETHGTFSRGIFAQSIGGGGGDGGFAGGVFTGGGAGGEGGSAANPLRIGGKGTEDIRTNQIGQGVTVHNSGKITTTGDASQGIFAQSVGGGGGNGGGSVSVGAFLAVAVGGTGAIGGDGGLVTVNNISQAGTPGPLIQTSGERSAGIFAQSVGGGGGSGGFAVAVSGGIFGGLTAAMGGDGAEGGDGGVVEVHSNGEIKTLKSFSSGIYAESIGGGGGRGGFSVAAGATLNGVQATLSFGGAGAGGGTGNEVTVANASKITTGCADTNCVSDESHGIFASSVGGGGGSGGFSIAAGAATYGAVGASFGGNAGAGNNSNVVDVDNDGEITTYGQQSHGILAQSIGGGGGSGGFSGSLAFSLTAGGSAALAFGGDGGPGGAGNTVIVDNDANIETFGNGSNGILAQSIGGGGGNGGFAGAISFTIQGVGSFANSVGGTAGEGSLGRDVTVTHAGAIKTHSDNATGIFAQSVGGGGGNGGFSLAAAGTITGDAAAQSVGGKGGTGGRSGVVKVGTATDFVSGSIETSGAQSHGIQAQSIAGGGGNGGFSVGAGFSLNGNSNAGSVGGKGGSAQHASQFITVDGQQVEIASVEVHSNARIVTGAECAETGADCRASGSHGIFAQSVGGGGGSGGFSIGVDFSMKGNAKANSVGGSGAGGGDGGIVLVESGGEITTRGPSSHGIFAQSVGGGGGSGAFSIAGSVTLEAEAKTQNVGGSGGAAGNGGEVTVNVRNNITTVGVLSHGVLAQSVGGGGGDGGFSLGAGFSLKGDASTSSIGGDGGGGGDGKKVTVNVGSPETPQFFPTIHTKKDGSVGVFAQSVGGGGGSGGFSGALSLALNGKAENKVGGDGGASGGRGGKGGEVQVSNWGTIKTEGDNAAGVLAQSVGGSGGNGGFSVSGTLGDSSAVSDTVGGAGGGGGHSSKVQVDNFGLIETSGNFSHGIIAQSTGGSGGNGGFSIGLDVGLSGNQGTAASKVGGGAGGAGGAGGEVVVNNEGTIRVTGNNAFGVFAQSVGGGGGAGGIAGGLSVGGSVESAVGGQGGQGGNGGDVTVISDGDIFITGNNSSAVFAQSVAGSGGWSGLAIGLGTNSNSDGVKLGLGSKDVTECLSVEGIKECLPSGGQQGKVTITIDGETTVTDGALSYGLLAQAIAGGGGAIGSVLDGVLNFTGSDVVIDVGSDNSLIDSAAQVSGTYGNNSTQKGRGSIGLIAQSIGGGGGTSGVVMDTANLNEDGSDQFLIRVGGLSTKAENNGGGSGGGFDFTAQGTVTTEERNAIGVLSQTIGGGGGVGNLSVNTVGNSASRLAITLGGSQLTQGDGGPTSTVKTQEQVTTKGILSHGMVVQSIGGGGGVANVVFQGGVALTNGATLTLGGAGGAGGNGGDLTATASDIVTTGVGAMGIVVQSIGGGGGLTGIASNGLIFGQSGFLPATPVNVVGGSDAAGSGGVVTLAANGDVHTAGFGAHGIVAQSIGGGGGIAGGGLFRTTLAGSGGFAGSVGGEGTAKDVSVTTFRNVVVVGQNSVGIFGQSAAPDGAAKVGIKIDKSGNGVGLIWAASGTGAAVQIADGLGNTLATNGTLYAQGTLAGSGLPANLNGLAFLGGAGDEAATNLAYAFPALPLPTTPFGFGADYGVVFDLTSGAIDPVTGLPVFDAGTRTSNVIGNINAAAGNNIFTNEAGALFITDQFVTLDDDGTPAPLISGQQVLANSGLLSPGDRGKVQVTGIAGNFTESASGVYFIDIDLNQQNTGNQVTDRLNVTGGSGVGGQGGLLLLSINKAFTEYVIVSSEAGTSDNGFVPELARPAIGFDFNVKVENGNKDLVLFADKPPFVDLLKDPASGTTDPNVWRMGEGLDNIEQAITVNNPFNYLINLLRLYPKDDPKAFGDAIASLTPSQAPHLFEATFRRNMGFLNQMTECPKDFEQGFFLDRRNCLWMQGNYGEYDRESVEDSPTNDDNWNAMAIGVHAEVDEHWQLGFGIERTEYNSNQDRNGSPLSTLDGEIYQLGVSANYRNGGFGVGLVAAGSFGDWTAKRFVNVNGFTQNFTNFIGIGQNAAGVEQPIFADNEIVFDGISGTAESSPEVTSFNPRLRLSYTETFGSVDVLPFFDIDGYILHTDAREEGGVGLANLKYPANTETTVTFTPGLELGGTGLVTDYTAVRAFVRGSVVFSTDDSWTAETQFVAAPEGLPDIEIIDKFDDILGKIDAGFIVIGPGGQFRVNYSGAFGETTEQHEVNGELAYRF
ncbi:MAG: hypothetical protein AB7F09_06105 [Parvibaculaceae bacterium]